MKDDDRPNPLVFLKAAAQEEALKSQGQLKIFLGMAAGVGKTYAMLEEAQKLQREGIDVVVGTVETHGRQETAELLEGLTIVPKLVIIYKDKEMQELDVDSIIALHPEVVLIDELAHENVPGSMHAKRWQDVLEILEHGIDVYATLNVQHIESLNDIIHGITGISVRETVPDLMIDKAFSIQLVDITPDELLDRLHEGKVYLPEQSQQAIRHFFQRDRLEALREIVLRYAADKIDSDLRRTKHLKEGGIEWQPREKFLVAISHSPHSQKLIRATRRLAAHQYAPWIALHVDNGRKLNSTDEDQLAKNMQLSRDLGAEVVVTHNPSIVEGIKQIAYQQGITQIIVGRTPSGFYNAIISGNTLLDQLASECKDIDIHVIRQEKYKVSYKRKWFNFTFISKFSDYLLVFLMVCVVAFLNWLILPYIGYKIVGTIFLIAILGLSFLLKTGPILFASILYMFLWAFLFIPPEVEVGIASKEDLALLGLYALTGATIGLLVERMRGQREMLAKSEKTTKALYEIVRSFSSNLSKEDMLAFIKKQLSKQLEGDYEFVIKHLENGIVFDTSSAKLLSTEKEKSAAIWVFENGKEAGWSTDTLPSDPNLYIPLKGVHEVIGLLVYRSKSNHRLSLEEKNFIYTVCHQLAHHLEQAFTKEKITQHDQIQKVDKVYSTILKQFSKAIEEPVTIAKNAISKLKDAIEPLKIPGASEDVRHLEISLERFYKIYSNISAMAKLSEGMIPLKVGKHSISKVIQECSENINKSTGSQRIVIRIEENLPPIHFDDYLIQILIQSLILNAIEHSRTDKEIFIEAKQLQESIHISVADQGKGIPENQLHAIFEKFYRGPEETASGVGLGLAIAKTIAEIHHGSLHVENIPGSGAKFTLKLPIS